MRCKFLSLFSFCLLCHFCFGQIRVHDPVMIRQDSTYYLFCTGNGISVWQSNDMKNWQRDSAVFAKAPDWALQSIPNFKGHIWAPDITWYRDRYYLFYSVSQFGKNTSAIGVASNPTLHRQDPRFQWQDHGAVVQSIPGKDDWNSIDPNLVLDKRGKPWLSFGSFWSGIQLLPLKADLSGASGAVQAIASRPRTTSLNEPGDGAIEAPFIVRRGKYFYLFVSFDYCCRGVNSTYKIVVGRSKKVNGPYVDKTGKAMLEGGGSLVLEGDQSWAGLGHNAVCRFDGQDYLVYHAYDVKDNGRPKLQVRPLYWDKGWPELK